MAITLNGSSSVVTNSGAVYDGIQRGTAVSASGTSIDFTGIPSWVKRITVMFEGVSTNGSSNILIRLGTSSGIVTTGYVSHGSAIQGTSVGANNYTTGFGLANTDASSAAYVRWGSIVITQQISSLWTYTSLLGANGAAAARTEQGAGAGAVSGTLDRIRITTVNGTDTFDAGSINILYE